MTTTQLLPTGCIFDGAHGDDFNGLRVQSLAASYGWDGQQEDDNSLEFQDAIEEATEYLEQFAPEGYYAGWNDGDYGVWENEEDNSCNQCEAAMINGVYCHETGCPNRHKVKVDGEWVAEEDEEDEDYCDDSNE